MTELEQAKKDLENYQEHARNGMTDLSDAIARKHGMFGKPFNMVTNEIRLFIKELENEINK